MTKHYLIVLNPKANRKKHAWLTWLIDAMKSHHATFEIYTTMQTLSSNQVYFNTHLHRFDEIIVLGGDGTIHMVANCLAHSDKAIAILPCGTGNDFMRNFNYSENALKQAVFSHHSQLISLGKVNQTYFANIAGVGFDAEVVKATMNDKGIWAKASYLLKTITTVFSYQAKPTRLETTNVNDQYQNFLTVFANGQYFGSGMKIAPNASLTSTTLECIKVIEAPIYQKIYALLLIFKGRHTQLDAVQSLCENTFTISTPNLAIEADGELVGVTPATFSLQTGALRLKTPV